VGKTAPAKATKKTRSPAKEFEAGIKLLAKGAIQAVQEFYDGKTNADMWREIAPLSGLSRYADALWQLVQAERELAKSPSRRLETKIAKLRTSLEDLLDSQLVHASSVAAHRAFGTRAHRKLSSAEDATRHELKAKRLGLTTSEYMKMLKKERAELDAMQTLPMTERDSKMDAWVKARDSRYAELRAAARR
jgi:hypothetical protein